MKITAKHLKDARAIAEITQGQLADTLGVHPKTIVNWEANGVPAKSAHKVWAALGDYLSYVDGINRGELDYRVSIDEWREWREQDRIFQQEREENRARRAEVDDLLAGDALVLDESDATVAKLAAFSTSTLIDEVRRRIILSSIQDVVLHSAPQGLQIVGGVSDDADPSKGDAKLAEDSDQEGDSRDGYGLAAKKRSKSRGEVDYD